MKYKLITINFIMMLLLAGITTGLKVEHTAKIIYVDDNNTKGPWDGTLEYPYRYIQTAIDNASNGDLIRVYAGIYDNPDGNVCVSKTLSIIGNGSADTFIRRPVLIFTNKVFFKGFTIDGYDYKTLKKSCCIKLKNSNNCNINHNIIATGLSGIELYNSSFNNIVNNTLLERDEDKPSIYLFSSDSNTIRRNYIVMESSFPLYLSFGIYLDHCKNNIIDNNKFDEISGISYNDSHSIFLFHCDNNTIFKNNITNCYKTINSISSNYNKIMNNTIKNSHGIDLDSSNFNIISGNIMSNLGYGISLHYSSNNTINKNILRDGDGPYIGLFFESINNIISWNSLVNNTWYGIVINSYNNIIKLNNIINNDNGGIWIYEKSNNNIILQNNIQGNGDKAKPWSGGIVFDRNYGRRERSNTNTICYNNIQNNNVGLNLSYTKNNNIKNNNFIGNEHHAYFKYSWGNSWDENYWDNWNRFGPKLILGHFGPFEKIPWINFDWHPASEPYDIEV